ncbi:hypothetical protein BN2537_249 [Streptomyces venezuelae]|nr:hypothetical protein BN2537_249 [Streptomyces venezuelae]
MCPLGVFAVADENALAAALGIDVAACSVVAAAVVFAVVSG